MHADQRSWGARILSAFNRVSLRPIVLGTLVLTLTAAAADLRLLEAIKRRDRKAVVSLLAQHADVNAAQPDGATALSWALYLDDRESADLLLAAGASVKTADE